MTNKCHLDVEILIGNFIKLDIPSIKFPKFEGIEKKAIEWLVPLPSKLKPSLHLPSPIHPSKHTLKVATS